MVAVLTLGIATGCSDGQTSFGDQDTQVDVAIVFERSTPRQSVSDYIGESLSKPPEEGRMGRALLPGIRGVTADYGKRTIYVTLESSITADQRAMIIEAAKRDDRVERVLEDVRPSAVAN